MPPEPAAGGRGAEVEVDEVLVTDGDDEPVDGEDAATLGDECLARWPEQPTARDRTTIEARAAAAARGRLSPP
jgi:hypothetical protein